MKTKEPENLQKSAEKLQQGIRFNSIMDETANYLSVYTRSI